MFTQEKVIKKRNIFSSEIFLHSSNPNQILEYVFLLHLLTVRHQSYWHAEHLRQCRYWIPWKEWPFHVNSQSPPLVCMEPKQDCHAKKGSHAQTLPSLHPKNKGTTNKTTIPLPSQKKNQEVISKAESQLESLLAHTSSNVMRDQERVRESTGVCWFVEFSVFKRINHFWNIPGEPS